MKLEYRFGFIGRLARAIRCSLAVFGAIVLWVPARSADETLMGQFERIFRQFETEQVALSSSGRYVAYTTRQNENLLLTVRDFEANTVRKLAIGVDQSEPFSDVVEPTPARLTFLRWAAEDRLVFNLDGTNVWSIRADFGDRRLLANGRSFDRGTGGPVRSIGGVASGPGLADWLTYTDLAWRYRKPGHAPPIDIVTFPRGGRFIVLTSRGTGVAGGQRLMLRVDAVTGANRELPDFASSVSTLCDRQGELRIILDPAKRDYRYRGPGGNWGPLAISPELASATAAGLPRSADRLAMATPFAFGGTPELLYCRGAIAAGYGLFAIDPQTWRRTGFELRIPIGGLASTEPLLVDDPTGDLVGVRLGGSESRIIWTDPELKEVQAALDGTSPKRRWKILEWNTSHDVFLTFEGGESDPGTYCLFRPRAAEIVEFMNLAPWLTDDEKHECETFACMTDEGEKITARLTRPRHARLRTPPLVVLCGDERVGQLSVEYHREAHALAAMGFAVLQVSGRASDPRRIALRTNGAAVEAVALDDILRAMDSLPAGAADRRLTAIVGRDYGGYLALRAMQLHPERFRCAVAIDAPTDLKVLLHPVRARVPDWTMKSIAMSRSDEASPSQVGVIGFQPGPLAMTRKPSPSTARRVRREFAGLSDGELEERSPATHPELVQGPVMIVEADGNAEFGGNGFAAALQKRNPDTVFLPLHIDEAARLPRAQAALYGKVYDFLTANIYNYAVKIGALQVVDDKPAPPKPTPELPKPDATVPKPDVTPPLVTPIQPPPKP